jgi:hypothetical protein
MSCVCVIGSTPVGVDGAQFLDQPEDRIELLERARGLVAGQLQAGQVGDSGYVCGCERHAVTGSEDGHGNALRRERPQARPVMGAGDYTV